MLKNPHLRWYRINEIIHFFSKVLTILKQYDPEKMKIKEVYDLMAQNLDSLKASYKQDKEITSSNALKVLDKIRDKAIISLRMVAYGYSLHHLEKLRVAGQSILDCIDKYGSKIYSLNYGAETTVLEKIGSELQSQPQLFRYVKTLHLEELLIDLVKSNEEFDKIFDKRLDERSKFNEYSTTEWINVNTTSYRQLIQHLIALSTLNPAEEFVVLFNHLNEIIDHYNDIVERRKSSNQSVNEVEVASDTNDSVLK